MSKYLYERKNATDLNSKEDIRVLCLPESVKEEGKVVVVVQGLKGYLVVEKGLTLVQALRSRVGAKGVGGFFLKIRPHSCV